MLCKHSNRPATQLFVMSLSVFCLINCEVEARQFGDGANIVLRRKQARGGKGEEEMKGKKRSTHADKKSGVLQCLAKSAHAS